MPAKTRLARLQDQTQKLRLAPRLNPKQKSQCLSIATYESNARDDVRKLQQRNAASELTKFKPALNLYLKIMRKAAEEVNPGYQSIVDRIEQDLASGSKGLLTILEPARMRIVGTYSRMRS